MKAFSGPETTCVKCGSRNVTTTHQPAVTASRVGEQPLVVAPEALRRTCKMCGFAWDEEPLSSNSRLLLG